MTDKYAGHTPGPWKARRGPGMYFAVGPHDRCIAKVGGTNELCIANARLIADAPSLLKMLEQSQEIARAYVSEYGPTPGSDELSILARIDAALNSDAPPLQDQGKI